MTLVSAGRVSPANATHSEAPAAQHMDKRQCRDAFGTCQTALECRSCTQECSANTKTRWAALPRTPPSMHRLQWQGCVLRIMFTGTPALLAATSKWSFNTPFAPRWSFATAFAASAAAASPVEAPLCWTSSSSAAPAADAAAVCSSLSAPGGLGVDAGAASKMAPCGCCASSASAAVLTARGASDTARGVMAGSPASHLAHPITQRDQIYEISR